MLHRERCDTNGQLQGQDIRNQLAILTLLCPSACDYLCRNCHWHPMRDRYTTSSQHRYQADITISRPHHKVSLAIHLTQRQPLTHLALEGIQVLKTLLLTAILIIPRAPGNRLRPQQAIDIPRMSRKESCKKTPSTLL